MNLFLKGSDTKSARGFKFLYPFAMRLRHGVAGLGRIQNVIRPQSIGHD